jgi:ABC-type branched-subunit amino acid transport system substrate-binding protein
MLHRRTVLTTAAAAGFIPAILRAAETPGVTATEIRIGNTMPYSGPASAYGTIGKAMAAIFRMANDQGGFAGRRVNFISYDDGYSPPKTVEQTRRLIEDDKVAALFAPLGTPTNSATVRYVNQKNGATTNSIHGPSAGSRVTSRNRKSTPSISSPRNPTARLASCIRTTISAKTTCAARGMS